MASVNLTAIGTWQMGYIIILRMRPYYSKNCWLPILNKVAQGPQA